MTSASSRKVTGFLIGLYISASSGDRRISSAAALILPTLPLLAFFTRCFIFMDIPLVYIHIRKYRMLHVESFVAGLPDPHFLLFHFQMLRCLYAFHNAGVTPNV